MNASETAIWRRSSYSTTGENCVEIAHTPRSTAVRDSKDPNGPTLVFPTSAFATFLRTLDDKEA